MIKKIVVVFALIFLVLFILNYNRPMIGIDHWGAQAIPPAQFELEAADEGKTFLLP